VAPDDCDNNRQSEIAMWLPKPEVLIFLELRDILMADSPLIQRKNQQKTELDR